MILFDAFTVLCVILTIVCVFCRPDSVFLAHVLTSFPVIQVYQSTAQEIAELYTRLEILKSKQIEGVKTTRYTTDAIRACQGRIRKLLQKVGGIEEIQIKVDDARTLAEYFSGIRYLPEFEKNTEKAAGLFKAMQVIFNFSVVVKTLATYYYSKEKRERTNS